MQGLYKIGAAFLVKKTAIKIQGYGPRSDGSTFEKLYAELPGVSAMSQMTTYQLDYELEISMR